MIQSVERALDILNVVAQADAWLGVREIARRTGLKVPTVQQLLKTLQKKAYLEFDPGQRKYRIGVAATLLARGADPLAKLGDFIKPFVDQLHNQFGETVVALVYSGGVFMSAACRPSIHQLTVMPPRRGQPVDEPQVMASGRLLLAFMPPEVQRRFVKDAATRALLPGIRESEVAEVRNVNDSGIAALAVPVRAACQAGNPDVLLALACSMPLQRWTAEVRQRVLDALRKYAAKAERALS